MARIEHSEPKPVKKAQPVESLTGGGSAEALVSELEALGGELNASLSSEELVRALAARLGARDGASHASLWTPRADSR